MNASVLFGAGWDNDSLEVLWRDAGRAFCGLWGMMLTAIGTLSYLFRTVLSIPLWRASLASRTNTSLRATWIAVGHCGRWICCASADTVRYAAELGYEVTVVKDATASCSDEHMHAALEVNLPNYASAIMTAHEIVAAISPLADAKVDVGS